MEAKRSNTYRDFANADVIEISALASDKDLPGKSSTPLDRGNLGTTEVRSNGPKLECVQNLLSMLALKFDNS